MRCPAPRRRRLPRRPWRRLRLRLLPWLRLGFLLRLSLLLRLCLGLFFRLCLLPWLRLLLFRLGLLFIPLLLLPVDLEHSSGKRNKAGQGQDSKKFHIDSRFFGVNA